MLTAYRIFKAKFQANWADGEGSFLYGGRWNSTGTRLLYTSASLSLAALEMLVNLDHEALIGSYSYAAVKFDESLVMQVEDFAALPANWRESPAPSELQSIGDEWARALSSLVLRVPTVLIEGEFNYLINVRHPAFTGVKLGVPQRFTFDSRLRS